MAVAKIGAVEYTDLHEALVAGSTAGSVVELLCDVDLKGKNWEPITDFAGTFDGKGFKISNLTITAESGNAGLFASLAGTTILRNFTIENVAIDAANGRAGAVTASCGSPCAVISNITVCGAIDIKGKEYVGALFGHAEYSHIADCHVDGGDAATSKVIASAKIGGIFGQPGEDTVVVIGCTVKNITIEATATGDAKVGAIAGRFNCDNSLINCSAENCIIKCAQPGATTIGGLVGRFENGAVGYILNTTAKNVELQIAGETVAYKDFGDLVSQKVAVGTDVVGNLDFAKNYQFTAGTFTPYGDCLSVINDKGAEVGLKSKVATGYAPIANGDGTYTIMPAWNVKFYVGDVVSNAQVVANGAYAQAFAYDTETIEAWTNAAGVAYTAVAITENTDFFAQVKAAPVVVYPEYIDLDDADMKKKYDDWSKEYGADTDSSKGDAFLWNADPAATLPTLKIESIAVADGVATIVVSAAGKDLQTGINGVLYVSGCNALGGEWVTTVVDATADSFTTDGKATFTVEGAQFMKAKIGFKAETPAVK